MQDHLRMTAMKKTQNGSYATIKKTISTTTCTSMRLRGKKNE